MTPEAARFLEKARTLLDHADVMLGVNLNDEAGRTAYLAGFHAAQAFIYENIGKALKTHKGVQTEFLRLTKDDPRFPVDLRVFLSHAYNLKAIADYETGPDSEVTAERARQAVQTGKKFVAHVARLLTAPFPSPEGNPGVST